MRGVTLANDGLATDELDGRSSLMDRYLDPATSLGEVLFGLIMTLTFTLGAGIIIEDEGREGARQLLIALIGCNIAWGIIDAALYLAASYSIAAACGASGTLSAAPATRAMLQRSSRVSWTICSKT